MATERRTAEEVWRTLRPHLEWAAGFSLTFLYAGHPRPLAALRERLSDSLQLRTLRLQVLSPKSPEELERLAPAILAARPDPGAGPLWVEIWSHGSEPEWRSARTRFLHYMNERRFLLERDVRRPVVLVLPQEDRGRVYIQAPDLWAVRAYTAELHAVETVDEIRAGVSYATAYGAAKVHTPATADVAVASAPPASPVLGAPPGPAEREWARLWGQEDARERLDPWDGYAAFDAAMERGDLTTAKRIAAETLVLARSQSEGADAPLRSRNLSIALDKLGGIEEALSNLEAARGAYRESLELCRRLLEVLGETPQALRDLSVSLNKVGGIEEALGNLEAARGAYRESLELARRLLEVLGETPQALRDLSVSLDNIGGVEEALGNLEAARGAYREGLELRRSLLEVLGETPPALRNLSISLDNVGGIEEMLGNLEAAREAYREGLELRRRLLETLGETPQALRDLSVSLIKVGGIKEALGKLETARGAYRKGLELCRRLLEALGETPQALRDLSVSLNKVGGVEEALGNLEAAREAYREGLELRHRLLEVLGETPQALRDLSLSLENVGGIEEALGKLEAARAAYREGLELRRLLGALGETPQALRDLSVSLDKIGGIEQALGNLEAARGAYRESLEGFRRLRVAFPNHPQFERDLAFAEARWTAFETGARTAEGGIRVAG